MSILRRNPLQYQQTREGQRDPNPPQCYLGFPKDQLAQESGRYEVGGSGGHSGSGGGRGIPECFGKEGPHHSIAGEKQAATQQPQRDMKPVTGGSFVRLSEFPLFSPCPESGFTDTLQVVGSQRQFGRGRRHGPEETRQQCIENSREHGSGDDGDDRRGTLFSNPSFYMSAAEAGRR